MWKNPIKIAFIKLDLYSYKSARNDMWIKLSPFFASLFHIEKVVFIM